MRGGIHFAADGASVVYAAGCGVALFNSGSRTQRLVPLADRDSRFLSGHTQYDYIMCTFLSVFYNPDGAKVLSRN